PVGTAGAYKLVFTAHNGVGSDAIQNFTLNIGHPPAITSVDNTTFTVGVAGTFTVTTSGFPVPTLTDSGTLPLGVTFNTSTGVFGGTPSADTAGVYHVQLTAH